MLTKGNRLSFDFRHGFPGVLHKPFSLHSFDTTPQQCIHIPFIYYRKYKIFDLYRNVHFKNL